MTRFRKLIAPRWAFNVLIVLIYAFMFLPILIVVLNVLAADR